MSALLRRAGTALTGCVAVLVIALIVLMAAAAIGGYRPVVITTGSMGEHAPPGSVVVAAPSSSVEVGDVLVMQREGRATVTHRVIEIQRQNDTQFAITKGDANEQADASPYPIGSTELVERTVVPHLGKILLAADDPLLTLLVVMLTVFGATVVGLRQIWRPVASRAESFTQPSKPRGRRRLAVAVVGAVGLLGGGVAWAVYSASDSIAGNVFSTPDCFDAQLGSVQHGQTINSVTGSQSIAIAAVDPTTSFVTVSTRSASNEPADSTVQARLLNPTTIQLTRETDAAGPVPIVVDWSVVEYSCGLSVQRGVSFGNGLDNLSIPISAVDPAASFVLLSAVGAATDTDFDGRSMAIAELTTPTNLRLRTTAPATLPVANSYAWQVVSFSDPTDVRVQVVSTTLAGLSASLPITTVDPETTFVVATAATASSGIDIGERMVRTHLSSSTSVDVARELGGDSIDVHVQVVELRDGSSVKHGTIDFTSGQLVRTVAIPPIDPARSTAFGTVQVPGSLSGGSTDMAADDAAGEAAATFEITDPETVTVSRDTSTAAASFGWQAVEWGGPTWWDPTSPFRQRIDVTTSAVAAPGGYSAPVVVDHAALVASSLSIPSGDDLRVLRWDGATWTELDRILDDSSGWDLADTTFWFRTIDAIAASTTDSYWLYFGNVAPPPPLADPENVWLLTEDFESGTLGDFEDRTAGTSWYSADVWTRRIPITIGAAAVGADLTDFTVLIDVTDADLAANAQADGGDIRFTAADGITPLDHEIESWNPGTGALTAWVRLPLLPTGSATNLFVYYGAPNAPAQSDIRATWSPETAGAWHLSRDPSGVAPQADDSTIHNHDGVSAGAMASADLVSGLIGDALDFDGVDDHLDLGTWELSTLTEATVSGWINLDSLGLGSRIFTKAGSPLLHVIELASDGATARARITVGGTTTEIVGGTLSTGTWHHLASVWDGSNLHLYVDGARVASAPAYGVIDTGPTMPVTIGDLASGTRPHDGLIDEVRLESVARPTAWLVAVESNQRNPGTFAVAGAPQVGSWFAQGTWSFRKPVVVDADQVDATLTDHALLVQIVDVDMAATAQTDGDDIVFTAADGVTRLDHEIESWNGGTGELTAWVRVPSLDVAIDTVLFAYYANGSAVDQQDPAGVFGPDADAIAHLGG